MSRRPLTAGTIIFVTALAALIWVAAAVAGLLVGSTDLGGLDLVWRTITGELSATEKAIVIQARLPRVIFAGIVGASLAVGGAVFQAVLRNPLADPYILGISGGAALGGTVVLVTGGLGLGALVVGTPVGAFVGALAALSIIFAVARRAPGGRASTYVLLLTGVIVNAFAASLIMFFQSVVSARKAQEILFYLMGALSVEGTPMGVALVVAALTAAAITLVYRYARALNLVALGDDEAAYLGVDVDRVRWVTVVVISFAVALAVAFSGIIGFVGLIVPHAIRLAVGPDHRVLLPASVFGGAAFLTVADLIARGGFGWIGTTLPVGVITSLIGAPIFLYFLARSLQGPQRWQ